MIRHITKVQPQPIEGAEETLETARAEFSSGNACVITPGMSRIGDGTTRMVLVEQWQTPPSAEDKADICELYAEMGLAQATEVFRDTLNDVRQAEQIAGAWLRKGGGDGQPS